MFLATLPEFLALIISLKGFRKWHYPHFKYMSITWGSLVAGNLLLAIAYLTLDFELYRAGIIASAPLTFAIMALVDSVSRQKVDPLKLFVVTAASSALVIYAFEPGSIALNTSLLGEIDPALRGNFMVSGSLIFLLAGLMWLLYMGKIHFRAPPGIKKYSKINFAGAIIAGPGSIIAFATGFVWIIPGTDYLLIGIGAFLCAYAFAHQPKLGYVLPFNVYRLMVVDIEAGITLYTYDWDESGLVDSFLFSGALQGVCTILQESVGKGSVQDIHFDQGVLVIQRVKDHPVAFVLIASRSSPILQDALQLFADRFVIEFGVQIKRDRTELTQFAATHSLVDTAFPFVVSRRQA